MELSSIIEQRMKAMPEGSYTTKLLRDENLRLKKLGEEAVELALACSRGSPEGVRAEAADLMYHLLVATSRVGVGVGEILAELDARSRAG